MNKRLLIFTFYLFAGIALQTKTQAQVSVQPQEQTPEQVHASEPTKASVQTQETAKMTLKDCMEYAISNSTKIRIQQAAVGDAQIDRRDAVLAAFTPTVSAQTYAYYNFGRSIDPQTNTYFNTTSFHNNYGLSAGITLFNGFQAVNNLRISKTALAMGRSLEKQVEADLCLAVMEAYYNVAYYKSLTSLYETQLSTVESSLKLAKRQEDLGQKGHADVVQMEADLADRQYDLVNTRNEYKSQLTSLQDLMFWPVDSMLLIDTDIDEDRISKLHGDAGLISDFAKANDPSVLVGAWKVENARRSLSTARWQLLPSLGFYAGWNTSYYTYQGSETSSFGDQFRNNGGEYVELVLSIPIFDRLGKHSAIAKKKNALTVASAEYEQKCREIDSEVRRAIQDSEGAQAALLQAQRKSEVQEEAYELNTRKFEQGLISPIEYRSASDAYLKSGADKFESLYKYLIKQSVVRYYGGEEYIDQ